jgi:hypothetical protein
MKDGGWLDKYQVGGNVIKTDATRVNKQMIPLNAKKVTQKQLDQREAQVRRNRINKANVAKDKMYTNPEEPIFGFSPEVFAESTSAIGDKLRVSDSPNIFDDYINLMPFFGEMASGLGKIPLNIKQGNYGQAAMNLATPILAGAGEESLEGLVRELGKTKIANNTTNVASAQDYVRRLYNPDDLFQRSILQDATENRLQDVVRPRQRLISNDKSVEPSSFYNNSPDPDIDYTFTPSDAEIINHNNHLAKLDRIIDRAIEKSSNVDYNLGTSVMGMPIPSNLNTLRNWDNYNANSFKSADYTNFLQQWREQNGLVNKKTLLGKLKDKAGKVINTADEKLGKLVSPPKSLPEGVTLEKLSDEINKELVKGVGVKKRNDQLRVKLSGDLDNMFANTQIIDQATNELVDAGFIKLKRQQQPYGSKKLSEVLFPNKKPSPYPGQDEWNNTLGFAKEGDFPFTKLSAQDKTILEKQGVSGEYNKAINEVLKRNNLGNVLSGGTGHTPKGGERWQNLIQKGLAEDLGGSYYKLKKNGGWLEKYNDGGPIQPNYNDYSVSAGPGFQGDGYSNVGRNYSPAWGGQFQMGGAVKRFMQPTETFKNIGYNPLENELSTEYSTSIGGDGEVYLVPGYRQGRVLNDPEGVFNTYGEHLGGPFKTVKAAEDFAKFRHDYVEKNKNIPAPFKTRDYAMGGSIGGATQGIPGATGFMYSRDSGSNPSEDKGRNKVYKTDASAQNGKEMKFYQEGLDFKPKSISKNGSVIKDDMGQYNHPGEITEIGSNQITMQGVPYPVLGISDTGDTQMMYPNEEYEFVGDSVTEYPMMQNGGWLDSLVDMGKGVVDYVGGLFEDPAPVVKSKASIKPKADTYDTLLDLGFNNPQSAKLKNLYKTNRNKTYLEDKNKVALNTGRFKGANVSAALIDDIAAAAKRNKIPVGQLLALAGRESTFGQQKGNDRAKKDSANNEYMSGWNVAEDYSPYDPHRFLADKKVPGIKTLKNSSGYYYEITDEKAAREYLKKNPQLIEQYKKKLASTPDIGNRNYFDLSAEFLKKKGIQGYNPGDPTYVDMFNQDYNTLKQDKELMSYLKKKGYRYEQGGQLTKLDQLTNFTNYNTKQPGSWLDKYQ